jgi:predicted CoA-binding protein
MSVHWKTAVIGVTPNESRYSYIAVTRLHAHNYPVVALGFRPGTIADQKIVLDWPDTIEDLKMVTMYIGGHRQPEFYDYILGLKPEKIIFNPGTENPEFYNKLDQAGILYEEACTLVLLSTNAYHL